MGAIKDSIKIIEKSEEEIDALKSLVDGLDLSEEDKATLIYGLNCFYLNMHITSKPLSVAKAVFID